MSTHLPLSKTHLYLRALNSGSEDIEVSRSLTVDMIPDLDLLETALDLHRRESQASRSNRWYIQLFAPIPLDSEEGFVIKRRLSPLGVEALSTMDSGVLWSEELGGPDVGATEQFYQAMMDKNQLDLKLANLLATSTDDRLTRIKGQIVYFKLQADRLGNGETAGILS